MKKIIVLLTCLALMSLACLQTAMVVADPAQTGTATPTFVKVQVHAAEPTLTKTPTAADDHLICARVVAVESLHLRQEASENSLHLTYMQHGEIVRVVDRSDEDWWFVERDGVSGYARSLYLEESECE